MCARDPKISGHMIAQIREDFFYNDEAKEAFNAVTEYYKKNGKTPTFRLLIESLDLSEDAQEFFKSGDIPLPKTIDQAEQSVKNLDDYRKTREMYTLATGILKRLEKPKVDIQALTSKVADRLTRISSRRTTEDNITHMGKDSNVMALIEDILYTEDQDQCIPTGFKTFDSINGGFFRGSLVVLASNSGAGKSILANQIALNQATIGYKSALVPLEMTESEMISRTMSSVTGMSSIDIFLKRLASGERDAIYKKMRTLDRKIAAANGRYTIFKPQEDVTIEALLSSMHQLNADVIYVDYITLLKDADGDEQWKKLGQIARFCKIYAENHNKVIVLIAQLSDEGRIRYSQTIKEHASLAWVWTATKATKERGYIQIEPLKSRNQDPRPFTLRMDYGKMKVADLEPEDLKRIEDENKRKERSQSRDKEGFKPIRKTSNDDAAYLPDLTE